MSQYPDHTAIAQKLLDQQSDINRLEGERDGAYRERAHLVAWLAAMHESVIAPAPDVDEPGWQIVYLYAGGWQMSWHISPRDAELFKGVTYVAAEHPRAQWDGHQTDQKYARIRNHTRVIHMNERLVVCGAPGPWGDAHTCNRPDGRHNDHEAEDGCRWRDEAGSAS